MFDHFFTTKKNSGQEIKLFGEKQQQHTVILSNNQTVEYFKLEEIVLPCVGKTIENLKACDYVLADHNNKKILLCELKNSSDPNTIRGAKEQLRHSEHIVNLFLKILEKDKYSFFLLALTKRRINKKAIRTKQVIYTETNQRAFKFNDLHYE